MQQFCTQKLIKDELEWYASEGLDLPKISLFDNNHILGEDYIFALSMFDHV